MEPKGNPNVPGDRKINKKTAASSATVKPNSKSPASSPIVSSALSTKSKAETALIHEEQGSYRPPIHAENPNVFNASNGHERYNRSTRQVASTLGYILQILFQTCAGAVLLTDVHCNKAFSQAVFLLGETFLKSLWFPLFRISYFVLWTGVFVILQWIVHACVSFWYAAVGLMHVPCFGVFALIVKLKYMWFSKCFSEEP
ncbi:BnaA03g53740D [Brassica napus]|uniref:BnaA03g53740D protein n=1 Tax=Brassica napus TaxID=3708 RepID=A0A078HYF2_BRANA|nr:BnaA03g53740D [Brassica napus]